MIPITAIFCMIVLASILSVQLNNGLQLSIGKKTYYLKQGIFQAISLIPVYVICAFQFSTSSDYYNYSQMFVQITKGQRSISEPLIYLIFKLVSDLHLNFQWVYVIIFLLVFSILYRTLNKYSKDYVFSTVIYMCVFWGLAVLQIRQLLAVVISFASYQYILERKPFKFLLLIIIASMCHASALVMLPAYFLLRYRYRVTDILMLSCVGLILGVVSDKILPLIIKAIAPSRLTWYYAHSKPTLLKWDLILLAILILIVIIYQQRVIKNQMNVLFINAFILYLILFFCFRWVPEIKRWGYYYFFPIIALIPNCFAEEAEKKAGRLYAFLILLYLLLYLLLIYKTPLGYCSLVFLK